MTTVEILSGYVAFNSDEAIQRCRIRARVLSRRRLVRALDVVELQLLVAIVTGDCNMISTSDAWRAVLSRHNHDARVPFDDAEGNWQHEPYATYRQETLAVYRRLEATAIGKEIINDKLEMCPENEQETTASKEHLDAMLRWAAEQLNALYPMAGHMQGKGLLDLFEFDARYAIEMHFAYQWFDDVFALGYAIETKPGFGPNAFGDARAQIAFVRTIAETINEAALVCDDASRAQEDRDRYSQRLVVLWPLLKGIIYAASDNSNSRLVKIDDELLEAICRALRDGKRIGDTADRLGMGIRGYSKDGIAAHSTPTENIVEKFRECVYKERADQARFAALIR